MKRTASKGLLLALAFVLFMSMAGTALAWQYTAFYTYNTLYGRPNGKPWSPDSGQLYADVGNSGGNRQTNPIGSSVWWNPTALSWIRSNDDNGDKVSITFHSYQYSNNGCSSFKTTGNAATNLPAPQYLQYWRQCFLGYTEGRVTATNSDALVAYYSYWGQAIYQDNNTTGERQKLTVDTYFGGQENWHQTYCVDAYQFTARVCP